MRASSNPAEAAGPVPEETVVDFIDPEVGQPPPPDEKAPLRDHSFLLALLRSVAAWHE